MTGPSTEFRTPTVTLYEPKPCLGGLDDGEEVDVSGFGPPPSYVVQFEARNYFSLFGKRIWTGGWKRIQATAR